MHVPKGQAFKEGLYMIGLRMDTNIEPIYAHSLEEFNSYVEKYQTENKIILTKSNNISNRSYRYMPCSLTWKRGNRMEFHYIDCPNTEEFIHLRVIYAIHYDEESDKDEKLAYDALNYEGFKGLMDLIPTDDIEENTKIFTCAENPDSSYYNYLNERLMKNGDTLVSNCYSLDRNNSFMASMKEVYPQTAPFVDNYYKNRLIMKEMVKKGTANEESYERFKLYGSIFVGWLKRKHREHAWNKIISNSNMKVHQLRKYVESQGAIVTLVNTDAVKFTTCEPIEYKDNYDLGGFKYEWKNTDMYIRGVKSYAYKEDDKWKFKQAGKCLLDTIKPNRDTWTLEDFKTRDSIKIAKVVITENGTLKEVFE